MNSRTLSILAVALLAASYGSDCWARSERGSGHAGHFGGSAHFGISVRGFAAPRFVAARPLRVVPRTVFFAGPVAYFRPAYYAPPPDYYYPPSYYEPTQPAVYYEQPVQSYPPPGGFYPPPPPAYNFPRSYYEPAQTPIYFCKDSSGRTHITNRKEATVGKDCNEEPIQSYRPSSGAYPPPPNSGSARASPRGPYAAQDASRYRSYCPDTRKYYPDVKTCASAWLKVVPDGVAAPR